MPRTVLTDVVYSILLSADCTLHVCLGTSVSVWDSVSVTHAAQPPGPDVANRPQN